MSKRKRYTLRIDESLFNQVERRATENKRSITKEIEFMLEQFLNEEPNK